MSGRLVCIGGLICAGGTLLVAAALLDPDRAPEGRLTAEPPEQHVSRDSPEESSREVRFLLRNAGAGPLRIVSVKASCGCTIPAELEKSNLAPDESVTLTAEVRPPPFGEQRVALNVETDSRQTPHLMLRIVMHGMPRPVPIMTKGPRHIEFQVDPSGASAAADFEFVCIERTGDEPWLRGLQSSANEITVELVDISAGPQSSDGTVERTYRFHAVAFPDPAHPESRESLLIPLVSGASALKMPTIHAQVFWPQRAATASTQLDAAADESPSQP